MKKAKNIFIILYFIVMGLVIFTSNDVTKFSTALEYISCGSANGIPKPVPQMTSILYTILMVGIPLVLIAFGIITLVKANASGKAEEMEKARRKLAQKFMIAGFALVTAAIVLTVVNRVANGSEDENSISNCVKCFLSYSDSYCLRDVSGNSVNQDRYYSTYESEKIDTKEAQQRLKEKLKQRFPGYTNYSSDGSNGVVQKGDVTILIGDSRTVGICGDSVSTINNAGKCRDVLAVRRGGMGVNWLKNTAYGLANGLMQQNPGKRHNMVILLGANDLGDKQSYADAAVQSYMNFLKERATGDWKNHNVIFVTVAPLGTSYIGGRWPVSQSNFDYFNSKMKSSINSAGISNFTYCDLETKMKSELAGKFWSDNLHFNTEGSTIYYNLVMNNCLNVRSSSGNTSSGNTSNDSDNTGLTKQINDYLKSNASGKWSVYIKNMKNNDIVSINSNEQMVAASEIKLFIMEYLYNLANNGSAKTSDFESDVRPMIQNSDNSATNRLIDKYGMSNINSYITSHYGQSKLQRKMLTQGNENYTSAKDIAVLLEGIYKGKLVSQTYSNQMLTFLKNQTVRTKIPQGVPSGVTVANKTGELSNVENDAAIVYSSKGDYIIVVLSGSQTNTATARNNIIKISEMTYNYYNK